MAREGFRTDYTDPRMYVGGPLLNKFGTGLNALLPPIATSWNQGSFGTNIGAQGMTVGAATITEVVDADEGEYKAVFRAWNATTEEWIDLDNAEGGFEFDLDAKVYQQSESQRIPRFAVDKVVAAYYDVKRNALVPLQHPFRLYNGTVSQANGIAGGASGSVTVTDLGVQTVTNPFDTTIANGKAVLVAEADGELVLWFPGSGSSTPLIFVRFALSEVMGATSPQEAAAGVVSAIGTDAPAALSDVTVYDFDDQFKDCMALAGGIAVNWGTAEELDLRILTCTRVARKMKLECTTSICATDTGDVTSRLDTANRVILPEGEYTDDPGSTGFVVTNPRGHAAENGTLSQSSSDFVWVERVSNERDGSGKWQFEICDAEKHEVTIPTEWRVHNDNGTVKLQSRGYKVSVEACDLETDWVDVLTLTNDCPV